MSSISIAFDPKDFQNSIGFVESQSALNPIDQILDRNSIIINNNKDPLKSKSIFIQEKLRKDVELAEIIEECSEKNWDGYGALPIQEKNIVETYHFLEMLPTYIKRPDIVPEPSGMIGLEWSSKNLDLVMSVDDKNIIFAVLYADGTSYSGTSKYNEEIPPIILEKIQKVTNDFLSKS